MQNYIIYEQPLNEKIRTILRLEFLFEKINYLLQGDSKWDSHFCIMTLIEILNVLGRGKNELKMDIIKEMEIQHSSLSKLQSTPNINHHLLQNVLTDLQNRTLTLKDMKGQIGHEVQNNELIKSIMQRSSIPGGNCDFDLPLYHYWLQLSGKQRKDDITKWMSSLFLVQNSIDLILEVLRGSAQFENTKADLGNYQHNLSGDTKFKLIRVALSKDMPYYAEISGSKHRFSIRFLDISFDERAKPSKENIEFELCCCAL